MKVSSRSITALPWCMHLICRSIAGRRGRKEEAGGRTRPVSLSRSPRTRSGPLEAGVPLCLLQPTFPRAVADTTALLS